MKSFKRISILLLALIVSSFSVILTGGNFNGSNYEHEILLPEDLFQNEEFVAAVEEYMIESFGAEFLYNSDRAQIIAQNILSYFSDSRAAADATLPDFLGGIYINDNGNLVVQVVDGPASRSMSANAFLSYFESDELIIEYVSFSEMELLSVFNHIGVFYDTNPDSRAGSNINAWRVDTFNNRVAVQLTTYSEDEIARFRKNIIDSPMVVFEKATYIFAPALFEGYIGDLPEPPSNSFSILENAIDVLAEGSATPLSTTLRPGSGVFDQVTNSTHSLGYRARTAGNISGIVTTGHSVVDRQSFPFGTVIGRTFFGRVDAAFIQTNANVTVTNSFPSPPYPASVSALSTAVVQPVLGSPVFKIGVGSGFTSGTIRDLNFAVTLNGERLSLVGTDAWAQNGDSGGIVFSRAIGPSNYNTLGIVSAAPVGGGPAMLFVRATDINTIFNLQRF
ncbi:MAG: S1 family peptidase [Defluviitaleaceae bacterium]|nr:S1 family peptidase [Defluviitaleaceae bacterium]